MKEIQDIVKAFEEACRLGKKTALATVVHVEGSSYRRPGARMLVTEDGKLTGAISGGCLEGDALRKAVLAIAQEKKKLVVYDTTDEDDAKFGIQLGCNGIVSILFEPIDPAQKEHPIQLLQQLIAARRPQVLVTGYAKEKDKHLGTVAAAVLPENLQSLVARVLANGISEHLSVDTEEVSQVLFFEYCQPSVSLVIVGAGNDALPLHALAKQLGWVTTLLDGRVTHANRQRFPLADSILVGTPPHTLEQLPFDNRTAIVLMTHNYQYDLEMLCLLQAKPFAYLGLLGPAAKRERLLQEAAKRELFFSEKQLAGIYGPTGIAIGAETAEQIAVSIVAEIMAVLSRTEPVHLRDKRQPIHFQQA